MFAECTIDKWNKLQILLIELSKAQWIFRGQADAEWLLNNSLQRKVYYYKKSLQSATVIEHIILEEFKRTAHHFVRYPPDDKNHIEWLSILQHHGGITRLVDFTRSFYVALFFALESSEKDACLWCISKYQLQDKACSMTKIRGMPTNPLNMHYELFSDEGRNIANVLICDDMSENIVFPVMPYRLNERMAIQQGIFLFPTNLCVTVEDNLYSMFGDFGSGLEEKCLVDLIADYSNYVAVKLVIPHSCHEEILADLYRMNITAATLFPGLDGLAKSLQYRARNLSPH